MDVTSILIFGFIVTFAVIAIYCLIDDVKIEIREMRELLEEMKEEKQDG